MEGASEEELEAAADYKSSLSELTTNSKPMIDALTSLADESKPYAASLVYTIEQRLKSAPKNQKLLILFLIDSICKNVKDSNYVQLFTQNIVSNFYELFKELTDKTSREAMWRTRYSWGDQKIFIKPKLKAIDDRVRTLDKNWPVATSDNVNQFSYSSDCRNANTTTSSATNNKNINNNNSNINNNSINNKNNNSQRPKRGSVNNQTQSHQQHQVTPDSCGPVTRLRASKPQIHVNPKFLSPNSTDTPVNKIAKKGRETLSQARAASATTTKTTATATGTAACLLDAVPVHPMPQQPQQQLPPAPIVAPNNGLIGGEAWLSDCDYRVYQGTPTDISVAPPPPLVPQQCQPPPPPPEPSVVHVDDLLESLVHSGLIRSQGPINSDYIQPTSPIQIDQNVLAGGNIAVRPPIMHHQHQHQQHHPPQHQHHQQQQQQHQPQTMPPKIEEDPPINYTVASLRICRKSLINSLYAGKQCTNCSMRFEDQDSKRYSIHLDWHFRQNLKNDTSVQQPARRKWYYPLDLWCQFREIHDEEVDNQNQPNNKQKNSQHKNDSNSLTTNIDSNCCNVKNVSGVGGKQSSRSLSSSESSPPTVVASQDEEKNICSVCYEKFEKFWAEDDEEWQLRNAVRHDDDDKVYHPICLTDMLQNSSLVFTSNNIITSQETEIETKKE